MLLHSSFMCFYRSPTNDPLFRLEKQRQTIDSLSLSLSLSQCLKCQDSSMLKLLSLSLSLSLCGGLFSVGAQMGSVHTPLLAYRHQLPQAANWLGRPAALHLGGKKTLFFTLGSVYLFNMAYFGVFFNLVLFLKDVMGEGSGAAARDTSNLSGSALVPFLVGAYIAESYVGCIWACVLSQTIGAMGLILSTVATSMVLSHGDAKGGVRSLFFISVYLLSIGWGAVQPAIQPLGADQFDDEGDKAMFFTRNYIFVNLAMASADTLVVYLVSTKGWLIGFGFTNMVIGAASLVLFLTGLPFYRQYMHKGDPYRRALQVLVATCRKWRVSLCTDCNDLYDEVQDDKEGKPFAKHTDSLRWLDKAAMRISSDDSGSTRNAWRLSTVTDVEDVKAVLRLLPIWACSIFLSTMSSQASTLFVEEGTLMDTSVAGGFTMNPATMNLFNIVVVVLVAPFYDAVVVPLARHITGLPRGLSPLHRVGLGYLVSIIALSLAAILEAYRLSCNHRGLSPPSIFWQVPEFTLLGFSLFLGVVGQVEFFYKHAPPSLRCFGTALCLTGIAAGSYVNSVLLWVVTLASTRGGQAGWIASELDNGHLDYYFWLLAGLGLVNLLLFSASAISFMRRHNP